MRIRKAYKIGTYLGILFILLIGIDLLAYFTKMNMSLVGTIIGIASLFLLFIYRSVMLKIAAEREEDKTNMLLIAAAAESVYTIVIMQNLTKDKITISHMENKNYEIPDHITIDELVTQVTDSIIGDSYKAKYSAVFTRQALLDAYERGESRVSLVYEQDIMGNRHWMETTIILTKGKDGDTYAVTMARTIDESVQRTFELEQAKHEADVANRAKSDFLASVSHEIRTPINAVLGMNTMILRESNQESIKEYARSLQTAGNTLLNIINDILDFSKIESGIMEIRPYEYNLGSLVNDLVNMMKPKAEEKNLTFDVVVNPLIPSSLFGDEKRIQQIMLNILSNAIKFTDKGTVRFVIDFKKSGEKKIKLLVSVKDTGVGIRKDDLEVIFSLCKRVEDNKDKNIEGIGLGLNITSNLLKEMGSSLEVESTYGVGSVFSFELEQTVCGSDIIGNYTKRAEKAEKNSEKKAYYRAPEADILVVDDVEMNLVVAKCLLKRLDINVDTVLNGVEAIRSAKAKKYDIIFIDAMMPEMSGSETMSIIRESCPLNDTTPLIVLTANALTGARESYMEEGFDDYLAKPIDSAELESMIEKYLPDEKLVPITEEEYEQETRYSPLTERINTITGINVAKGIEAASEESLYLKICKMFCQTANDRIKIIEEYYNSNDWENYTIQVHALKSSARLLGAGEFADKAFQMEMCGKNRDIETIKDNNAFLMNEYRRIRDALRDALAEEEKEKPAIDEKELARMLLEMNECLEVFDHDTAESIIEALEEHALPEDFKNVFERLKVLCSEVDRDGMIKVIREYTGR